MSFIFLFAMGLLGFIVLLFVDVDKAKLDSAKCESNLDHSCGRADVFIDLQKEAQELYSDEQRRENAEETEAELHARTH